MAILAWPWSPRPRPLAPLQTTSPHARGARARDLTWKTNQKFILVVYALSDGDRLLASIAWSRSSSRRQRRTRARCLVLLVRRRRCLRLFGGARLRFGCGILLDGHAELPPGPRECAQRDDAELDPRPPGHRPKCRRLSGGASIAELLVPVVGRTQTLQATIELRLGARTIARQQTRPGARGGRMTGKGVEAASTERDRGRG